MKQENSILPHQALTREGSLNCEPAVYDDHQVWYLHAVVLPVCIWVFFTPKQYQVHLVLLALPCACIVWHSPVSSRPLAGSECTLHMSDNQHMRVN